LDYTSNAFSVEVRYPFWDKRLIEFCLSLPAEQKIRRGWTRMVMRRAMDGVLPRKIQWRKGKTDMAAAFKYGLLRFGRDHMDRFILREPEFLGDYVDMDTLRAAHQRVLNSNGSVSDVMWIQRSLSLALWLQRRKTKVDTDDETYRRRSKEWKRNRTSNPNLPFTVI